MSRVRMGLLSVLGLAAFAAVPAPAQAALECGDEIDRDTKLKKNLVCALNQSGLVIDSNGVDLDLNGHKIKGTGTDGVALQDFDRVTIHGGTIEGFEHGILAVVADDLTVRDMKIKDSLDQSVRLNQVTDSVIRDNELLENQTSNNVVVFGGLSEKVTVARNRMTKGGISFDGGANHRAVGNTITDALSDAITLGTAGSFLVRGNTIEEAEGFGVIVDGAVGNTAIESNRITGTASSGIFLSSGVESTTIDDNEVLQTSNNGISVQSPVTGIKIRGNKANGNSNNGIGVAGSGALIKNNVANRNEGYGILSASSTGSGNKAKDNGNPAECSPASLCE